MKNLYRISVTSIIIFNVFGVFSVAAQVFDPGSLHTGLSPTGGDVADCVVQDPAGSTTFCDRSSTPGTSTITEYVYATEGGASSSTTAATLYYDFAISASTSRAETPLIMSLISMDISWAGFLMSEGPRGSAQFKVEIFVTDITDMPEVTDVAYALVENKEIFGSQKLELIADGASITPISDFATQNEGPRQAVLPVALRSGRKYRVTLNVLTAAIGATASSGEARFASGVSSTLGGPASADRFVRWNNLSITVGDDLLGILVEAIIKNADDIADLKERLDNIENAITDHTHTYLTGRGNGHNNTEAETSGAALPPSIQPVEPAGGSGFGSDDESLNSESTSTNVLERVGAGVPDVFALETNYPNPFNPTTVIQFDIPENSIVSLKIYDLQGREVKTLVADQLTAGTHRVTWDASQLASGNYLYRIQAGSYTETKLMVLVK